MQLSPYFMRIPAAFSFARQWAAKHVFASVVIGVVALSGGYWAYAKATSTTGATLYSVGTVAKSTIVSSVSASGQVSASNQLDLTPDVSGTITSVNVAAGERVGAGAVIARIDASDQIRAVRDAQANLQSAQLALEKLQKPATALTLTQAQNALQSAQDSETSAQDTLAKAYSNANSDIVSAFLAAPDLVTTLQDVLTGTDASPSRSQWNMDYYSNSMSQFAPNATSYHDDAYQKYNAVKSAYDSAFAQYQSFGATPTTAQTDAMLDSTKQLLDAMTSAVLSSDAFIRLYQTTMQGQSRTVSPAATNALSTLGDLNTKLSGFNNSISADRTQLLSDKQALSNAQRSITEKQQSLQDVQTGADAIDIQSAQLTIQQRQNAVADAESTLAKYTIRAPFAGTIASVAAKVGQRVSSGAIATIVTNRQLASLSLNEVDVSKVALGDKATLTFDAIDGLTLTGTVDEIDTVGTVSQGVVSYTVKISFDSQDARIKPGMTVNAAIITDSKTDVLSVPSSAVKTQNGTSYVLVFTPELSTSGGTTNISTKQTPTRVNVETGITDDTNVEIISGLTEGQQIVTRTTTSGAAAASAARTTGGAGGGARGGFGGGGGIRL